MFLALLCFYTVYFDSRLYMVTWNVATRHPEEDLNQMLGFGVMGKAKVQERLPDFYVVGLQEVKSQPQNILMDAIFDDPWTNAYRDVLAAKDYVKVKTIRLQGLLLSLFCLRKHLLHLRDIETQYTRTGFGGMWGNKGAVTIRLSIYGCSVCIVNCHLTPHDHLLQERITDYNNIIKSQLFRAKETSNIFFHDYVFWIGDLNFRLMDGLSAEEIDQQVKKGEITRLLDQDQLRKVMASGEAFSELYEQLPTFPPTYKFEFHSSRYDLKRRPSWTDRILYKVNANVYENLTLQAEQVSYRSIGEYIQSDHKPVVGEFVIKDGFTSLEDYLCYVYAVKGAVSGNSNGRIKKVIFPETAVRGPGLYRLLYFNHNSGSVLGMSDAFQVCRRDNGQVTQFVCREGY
ncbi:Phosphatidylinositol 4 [Blattella germanica]|nr:Phosphatidylinositol 4 [Blattella germanica]